MADFSTQDILSSDGKYPDRAKVAPALVVSNASELAKRVGRLLALYGKRPKINSGYRTPEANKAAGGAPGSAHLVGMAVDFTDPGQALGTWCRNNRKLVAQAGLWFENIDSTRTWCHLQWRAVPGHDIDREFKP